MDRVRAKKSLGQHFLKDLNIARQIAESLQLSTSSNVVEVGPGMGVLTQFLLPQKGINLFVAEIDRDSVAYLNKHFPMLAGKILDGDFLHMNLSETFNNEPYAIIGNFPYNISSQIFFNAFDNRDKVTEVVGMVQKEVAARIAAPHGSKTYGILSVLLQAFYDVEYLFTVGPEVFTPPPKVQSGVFRMTRNQVQKLDCDEKLFVRVVKQGFNNRRKTLRNALKPLNLHEDLRQDPVLSLRAEQLSTQDFQKLTLKIQQYSQ